MHEHNDCQHELKYLKYCKHCDVVYCKKCKKEWGKKETIYVQVYPRYWPDLTWRPNTAPYYGTPIVTCENTGNALLNTPGDAWQSEQFQIEGVSIYCSHLQN